MRKRKCRKDVILTKTSTKYEETAFFSIKIDSLYKLMRKTRMTSNMMKLMTMITRTMITMAMSHMRT